MLEGISTFAKEKNGFLLITQQGKKCWYMTDRYNLGNSFELLANDGWNLNREMKAKGLITILPLVYVLG